MKGLANYRAPYKVAFNLKNGATLILPHYGELHNGATLLDQNFFQYLKFGPVQYSDQTAQELDALVRRTFKDIVVSLIETRYSPKSNTRDIYVNLRERIARPKRFEVKWPSPGDTA